MSEQMTPVPSRQTTNPAMAARGLRTAGELAQDKPCGTRIRYYAGCRCSACRQANTAYENGRRAARARGDTNRLVSADKARAHLAWLSARGIGRKTAADAAKVPPSIVSLVIDGQRLKIREATERRILAVTEAAAADRAYVDATASWQMLDELIACGYTKRRIGSELIGHQVNGLQLDRTRITVRNAELVRRVYARLRYASAPDTQHALGQLGDLREECFRPDRVLREAINLARQRGLPEPTLATGTRGASMGRLRAFEVDLVRDVHAALMGEDA